MKPGHPAGDVGGGAPAPRQASATGAMVRTLPLRIAGEDCLIDGRRALYWHGARTLVVADVHLGKGEAFRRQGVAVPSGHSQADCDALGRLLEDYRPARLVVCGDLFHAAVAGDEAWMGALRALRAAYPDTAFEVALGNHDRKTRCLEVLHDLDIGWHERLHQPPFVFAHEPANEPGGDARGYALCGHLHPVVRLRGGGDALRLPALWLRQDHAVLPAFGSFTGGCAVQPESGERLFAVAPEAIMAVEPAMVQPRRRPLKP